jgi:RimJ/RimL family protein N-acetyltransferase
MSQFKVDVFDPKTANDALWEQYFEFSEAIHNELHPDEDDPPTPRKLIRRFMTEDNPHRVTKRWIVFNEDKSQIHGFTRFSWTTEASPDYEDNKHVVDAHINVAKVARRQGLANTLVQTLLQNAVDRQATVLQTYTISDDGKAMCESMGGTMAIEAAENRLKLSDVDWDMIEQWAKEGPNRAPDVSVEMFNDAPEADLDQYCKLYTDAMNLQPMGEMEGKFITTAESRRVQEERMKKMGFGWTTKITREPDGTISGLTEVGFTEDEPHKVQQMLTGVDPAYRGKGLGKWLKADMLLHVRDNLPEAKIITTGNADSNAPMLSINERMGFKRHVGEIVYKFDVAELCKKLDMA